MHVHFVFSKRDDGCSVLCNIQNVLHWQVSQDTCIVIINSFILLVLVKSWIGSKAIFLSKMFYANCIYTCVFVLHFVLKSYLQRKIIFLIELNLHTSIWFLLKTIMSKKLYQFYNNKYKKFTKVKKKLEAHRRLRKRVSIVTGYIVNCYIVK